LSAISTVRAVPDSFERRTKAGQWVALLTLAWVIAVPVLLVTGITESWSFTSEPNPNRSTGSLLLLTAAVIAVLLPLLATVLAFRGARPVVGTVYALLTLALLLPAGLTVRSTAEDLGGHHPAAPESPPGPPGRCMEHSGGEATCPGG
jgi:hypothetical protein